MKFNPGLSPVLKIVLFLFLGLFNVGGPLSADGPAISRDPNLYVLGKFRSYDSVFLGTQHKRPPVLKFLRNLISHLHNAVNTHVSLEIRSVEKNNTKIVSKPYIQNMTPCENQTIIRIPDRYDATQGMRKCYGKGF